MGFQPYDVKMYKFKRSDNIRVLYDCMLEIENLEHINKKLEIGFFKTTIRQLILKSELTKSQVERNIKKLIDNEIITQIVKGQLITKTPSIFCFTEIIDRTIERTKARQRDKTISKTERQDSNKKVKRSLRKGLKECKFMETRQRTKTISKTVSKTLIKECLKDNLKDNLKDKGKEKENIHLSFQEELELFGQGSKFKNDELYFDDKEDIYK